MKYYTCIALYCCLHLSVYGQLSFHKGIFSDTTNFLGETVLVIRDDLDFKIASNSVSPLDKSQLREVLRLSKQKKYTHAPLGIEVFQSDVYFYLGKCNKASKMLHRYYKNTKRQQEFIFLDQTLAFAPQKHTTGKKQTDAATTATYPEIAQWLWKANLKDQSYHVLLNSDVEKTDSTIQIFIDELIEIKNQFQLDNERLLSKIVDSIGWPTKTKVGAGASLSALMIASHSSNLSFQESMLSLLAPLLDSGEVSGQHYQYLQKKISTARLE